MKVSVSKIKTFLRCRLQYYYLYVEKIIPKRKPVALERGSIIHACLEAHYKGRDWPVVLATWVRDVEDKVLPFMTDDEKAKWADLPREVSRIVSGYFKAFARHDSTFKVLAVEKEGEIPLPSGITLEYRIDRLLEEISSGLRFVLDSKTVGQIPEESVRFTDVQTAVYAWAEKADGVIWDYVRTKAPTVPKVLKSGAMSRDKSIDTDWLTYKNALLAAGLDPAEYEDMRIQLEGNAFYVRIKQGKPDKLVENIVEELDYVARQIRQIHKVLDEGKPVKFPRTMLPTCSWDCAYRDICFAGLAGQDTTFIRNSRFEPKPERGETDGDTSE